MEKDVIKIGLLGLGTVGSGVVKILRDNKDMIAKKVGARIEIARVLVRDPGKKRGVDLPLSLFTDEARDILEDPEIDIVVEVMGGIEPSRIYVMDALRRGKNVVTANKDLMALHGKELFEVAEANGKDLFFEASVGGGIPIIRPLKRCLAGNRILEVKGIINGTTNYILTKMTQEGSNFEEVLQEAQALGYAEADPTADVGGHDAARKIAILASIAFNTRITYSNVYVEGITKISARDIEYARQLGYVIKLLGVARELEGKVEVGVYPSFVPKNHPLASVNAVFNAIFVVGDAVGETMFYGRGAGSLPTGSAVVGDIIDVARNMRNDVTGTISCTCFANKPIRSVGETSSQYYLRLQVKDRPGVFAAIASIFGARGLSLESILQKERAGDMAEIVLVTHLVKEKDMRQAVTEIEALPLIEEVSNVIRVEGGEI